MHMYFTTLGDLGETAGPRIDRIQPARPPWWDRQFRELKKLIFSPPSKCPIDLFGPLANRTVLKRLHTCRSQKATKRLVRRPQPIPQLNRRQPEERYVRIDVFTRAEESWCDATRTGAIVEQLLAASGRPRARCMTIRLIQHVAKEPALHDVPEPFLWLCCRGYFGPPVDVEEPVYVRAVAPHCH